MPPLTIVMYHYVRPIADGRFPGLRGLEPAQFSGQLDYIMQHYRPVSLVQLLEAIEGGRELPERAILLQFDDGYTDHVDYVLPELERRAIKGVFFPITSAALDRRIIVANRVQFILARVHDLDALIVDMERAVSEMGAGRNLLPLSEYRRRHFVATRIDVAPVIYVKRMFQVALPADLSEEVSSVLFRKHVAADEASFADELYLSEQGIRRLIDAGHHVGCHSESHPWMGSLSKEKQRSEIVSALRLHDRIGLPRRGFTFCYPYGDYNSDTLDVLTELECAAGFTAEVALAAPSRANRLVLPRLDTIDLPMAASADPNPWTRRAVPALSS